MSKVLIADRDPRSREFLLALCKSKGYEVEVAGNSGDALRKIQDEGIDVIFLDCDLPGMNTIDLVSVINELKRDLPIIITAEQPYNSIEIQVRSKKIFYFADKPLESDEIEKVIMAVSDKITSKELIKKDRVIEGKVKVSGEERAKKDEMRKLKEEYDGIKKQVPEKLKSYKNQIFETISETGSAAARKIQDADRTISKAVGNVPVPKLEFFRRTLNRPISFIDNSMSKLSKQFTNIFITKKKTKFK